MYIYYVSIFLWSLFDACRKGIIDHPQLGIAAFLTISIACLFNSSFMDHNDGALFHCNVEC